MAATETYIGQPLLRKEDPSLLTGQAHYIDNWTMPGMVWMAMVRPPVRARDDRLDRHLGRRGDARRGRRATPAADLEVGALPFVWPITEDIKIPVHYPLTKDKIRFAGDAVAVVVAETREQAADAAEAVVVTATALPAVTDLEAAAADGAPRDPRRARHERLRPLEPRRRRRPDGLRHGAGRSCKERYRQPRLIPNAIEPRGCLAIGRRRMDEWTLCLGDADPAHR